MEHRGDSLRPVHVVPATPMVGLGMMRPKPHVGQLVTMLPDFGDPIKCKVTDLLSMMFTATQVDGDRVLFLYYDRLKGDSWEYTRVEQGQEQRTTSS